MQGAEAQQRRDGVASTVPPRRLNASSRQGHELPLPRCLAFSPWVTVGLSPRKSSAPVRKLRRRRAPPLFSNCVFDRTSRASINEFDEPPSDAASSNDAAAIFRYRFADRLVRFPAVGIDFLAATQQRPDLLVAANQRAVVAEFNLPSRLLRHPYFTRHHLRPKIKPVKVSVGVRYRPRRTGVLF
jgi:hypothetical protein